MDKEEIYNGAIDLLMQKGYEASLRDDYSGRGMYGETTWAIDTDASGVMVGWAITEAARLEYEVLNTAEQLEEGDLQAYKYLLTRTDNMGLGRVYY